MQTKGRGIRVYSLRREPINYEMLAEALLDLAGELPPEVRERYLQARPVQPPRQGKTAK